MELIAEIGWNHMGNMELLEKMVHAAKGSGATHAKFQTWHEKHLKPGPWDTDGRREIYKKAELSLDQFKKIKSLCDAIGIRFLTSVFNSHDVEDMAKISSDEIKIPSPEIANARLLDKTSKSFKKIYLSTGASTEEEVSHALKLLKHDGANVVLMHCVSMYPCNDENVNLPRLMRLKGMHPHVGLSDHTPDILSSLVVLGMGVEVIEKHFTIDNDLPGRDNKFAVLPQTLKELAQAIGRFEKMRHDHGFRYQAGEVDVRNVYRGRWAPSDY